MKRMKGISPVIAVVLLVVIVVGLASFAYVYLSSLVVGRTSKVVSLSYAFCKNNNMTLVLKNDGTSEITVTSGSGDLKIFVDGNDDTPYFNDTETNTNTYSISPGHMITLKSVKPGSYPSGSHELVLVTRSNSVTQPIICE